MHARKARLMPREDDDVAAWVFIVVFIVDFGVRVLVGLVAGTAVSGLTASQPADKPRHQPPVRGIGWISSEDFQQIHHPRPYPILYRLAHSPESFIQAVGGGGIPVAPATPAGSPPRQTSPPAGL